MNGDLFSDVMKDVSIFVISNKYLFAILPIVALLLVMICIRLIIKCVKK